jgi:hypothetical protein
MKKTYLTVNYNAKIQALEGANTDEILENVVINSVDPEVFVVDSVLDEANVMVDQETPDFFKLDTRMKVVVEHDNGNLEDIVESCLEFEVEGLFVIWDYEVYGWGVEDSK